MKKLIVLTIGFDEKYGLKALLRKGITIEDKVLVLVHENPGSGVKASIDELKEVLAKALGNEVTMDVIEVPIWDFFKASMVITEAIKERLEEGAKVRAALSSGSRALILETIFSLIMLGDAVEEVEADTEDGRAVIIFPKGVLRPPQVDETDIEILSFLFEGDKDTNELQRLMSAKRPFPKSTLFKRLIILRDKGLVEIKKRGKPSIWTITDVGRIYYRALS
ncbi:MAG: CRISPR locus-related DNA-binding protein [Thermoplasmata archaeon]|nr:CRISPR locus-related DNA-binding protein [Thermoplasmata archaeon]